MKIFETKIEMLCVNIYEVLNQQNLYFTKDLPSSYLQRIIYKIFCLANEICFQTFVEILNFEKQLVRNKYLLSENKMKMLYIINQMTHILSFVS